MPIDPQAKLRQLTEQKAKRAHSAAMKRAARDAAKTDVQPASVPAVPETEPATAAQMVDASAEAPTVVNVQ